MALHVDCGQRGYDDAHPRCFQESARIGRVVGEVDGEVA